MEIKTIAVETQVNVEKRLVTAYASVFHTKDRVGDVVHPGAFKQTLRSGPMAKGVAAYKYNHKDLIGKPVAAEEDTKGLLTEARVSKTPLGDEKLELMRDGSLNTYSFKYATVNGKSDMGEDGTRNLRELKLYEFGPVDPDLACNPEAIVLGVKGMGAMGDGGFCSIWDYTDALSSYLRGLQAKDALTPEEITMLNTAYATIQKNMAGMKSLLSIDPPTLLDSDGANPEGVITKASGMTGLTPAALKSLGLDSVVADLSRESARREINSALQLFSGIAMSIRQ